MKVCLNSFHEMTPENTYIDPLKGWRRCKACRQNADLRRETRSIPTRVFHANVLALGERPAGDREVAAS